MTDTPEPAPTSISKITVPFVSSLLALANGRKGTIVILALVFSTVVYLREPAKLNIILAFLGVLLPAYFGSQAYEDGKKQEAAAAKSDASPPTP